LPSVAAEVAGSSPAVPAINRIESMVYGSDIFFQVVFEGAEASLLPADSGRPGLGQVAFPH
jgi:hypothetical protein